MPLDELEAVAGELVEIGGLGALAVDLHLAVHGRGDTGAGVAVNGDLDREPSILGIANCGEEVCAASELPNPLASFGGGQQFVQVMETGRP